MKITITQKLKPIFEETLISEGHTVYGTEDAQASNAELYIGYAENKIQQENFPNLKYIQLASAGYDNLDLEKLKNKKVQVANAKGVYSEAIAEYVLTYILYALKDIKYLEKLQETKTWDKSQIKPKTLMHQNVFLLGTGSISQEVAKRLKAFSAKLTGFNSNGRSIEHFDETYPLSELKERIKEAEIIVAALPDNESTNHLITKEMIQLVQEDAIFINVGRGGLVDEKSIQGHTKHLRKIILDVFETEPLPTDSYLWTESNVITTPHMSFYASQNDANLVKLVLENINNIEKQKSLTNQIL